MSIRKLRLRSGLELATLEWGVSSSSSQKVICLHGWLDNAYSFSYLGPALASKGYHVVAYDNVGHGSSQHLPASSKNSYNVVQYTSHLRDVVDTLQWDQSIVVGHSLGAFIATLFAGSHPDRISRVALIDGFTPMTESAAGAATTLRKALNAAQTYENKKSIATGPKPYKTLRHAIDARMSAVAAYPGKQTLSMEAATALVRGSTYLGSSTSTTTAELQRPQDLDDGPVYFRHDGRLMLPSHTFLNNEQVKSFVEGINANVCLIQAQRGWPASSNTQYGEYKRILEAKGKMQHHVLQGSHHLHLDPTTAPLVASTIVSFLQDTEANVGSSNRPSVNTGEGHNKNSPANNNDPPIPTGAY